MSATLELSAWQKFHSHVVNCSSCKRDKKKIVKLCKVGALLYARANAEPEASGKPMSFPFVAKLYERVGTPFGEGVVVDRSIQSPEWYIKTDFETGTERWRTAGAKIVGYEIETDDRERHYVRPHQIKSLREPRIKAASAQKVELDMGKTAPVKVPGVTLFDDLILRRSE